MDFLRDLCRGLCAGKCVWLRTFSVGKRNDEREEEVVRLSGRGSRPRLQAPARRGAAPTRRARRLGGLGCESSPPTRDTPARWRGGGGSVRHYEVPLPRGALQQRPATLQVVKRPWPADHEHHSAVGGTSPAPMVEPQGRALSRHARARARVRRTMNWFILVLSTTTSEGH